MGKLPRGLKKALKSTSPVKLAGSGKFRGFALTRANASGRKLRGLTKQLHAKVYSTGTMPASALKGKEVRLAWKGRGGGRKRGKAVDAQLSRAVNAGTSLPKKGQFSLTKLALLALNERNLTPIMAQRGCCSEARGIATAADVVCLDTMQNKVVVVELKCGHSGDKYAAARLKDGCNASMRGNVLSKAPDSTLNRHFAQLAVTRHMLAAEKELVAKLGELGVGQEIGGLLLYVNEVQVESFELPEWWTNKARQMLIELG